MTVASRSLDMLKLLMQNKSDITIKDPKGDTVKDLIYRYMQKDTLMLDTYRKYENKMLLEKIFNR